MRIAFDIGNVLVRVDFEEFFSEFRRLVPTEEEPFTFLCDVQARQDIGVKTLAVALKAVFNLTEKEIDPLLRAWNGAIQPNEKMLDFVDELKDKGTNVALLSNMGLEHAAYIRKEYPRIFDGCTLHLSCEVGARKPQKLYYQSFLMENPHFEGCMFLDDRPENLAAAESFGMEGVHFELDRILRIPEADQDKILGVIRSELYRQVLHGTKRCIKR